MKWTGLVTAKPSPANTRRAAVTSRVRMRGALLASLIVLAAATTAPLAATTLIRSSIEDLTATNRTVVVGEVLDTHSYWNDGATFILTDVEVAVQDVLKGEVIDDTLTVTLMGGTVGDLSTMILGGATLDPGRSYVLFLNEENLPGAPASRTVRDHCQGVFTIEDGADGVRAISQANGHPLEPDGQGLRSAPGGEEGFPVDALRASVRQLADQEVSR